QMAYPPLIPALAVEAIASTARALPRRFQRLDVYPHQGVALPPDDAISGKSKLYSHRGHGGASNAPCPQSLAKSLVIESRTERPRQYCDRFELCGSAKRY